MINFNNVQNANYQIAKIVQTIIYLARINVIKAMQLVQTL